MKPCLAPVFVLLSILCLQSFVLAADQPAAPATAPADARFGKLPDTNTVFTPSEYKSLKDWETRRDWLREQVRVASGLVPEPKRTPLNARIFDKREYDGVTIEKVTFESYPGFYVFANLYRPAKIEGKIPGVLCAIGHWEHGRLQEDDNANYPTLGRTLAKLGMTVLIYDMTGYNEGHLQIKHGINTPARDLWGITSFHLQTWNSIRAADLLTSLPEVDAERIGMTGASGGGTQTFILYAVDDRIKVAVPVNMISSTMQGGCVCENTPCLRIDTQNMEIGALMAPKPMLMISTSGDWTTKTPQVEFPFIRSIYALYGKADNVENAHFNYPHNYNKDSREAMYTFMAKRLLGRTDADKITEADLPKIDPKELEAWTDETAPKDLAKIDQLTEQLKTSIQEQIPHDPRRLDELKQIVRTGIKHMVGSDWAEPKEIDQEEVRNQDGSAWSRTERKGRQLMTFTPLDAASSIPPSLLMIVPASNDTPYPKSGGGTQLYLKPFGTGSDREDIAKKRQGKLQYFATFNRTDAAEGVFDILTLFAINTGDKSSQHGTQIISEGMCGPMCLAARAMMPDDMVRSLKLRTVIDLNGFNVESDDDYLKQLNIPLIRRIGGLRAIAAVACNGPIFFHNVGNHFDEEWIKSIGKANGVEVRIMHEKADAKAIAEWLYPEK